MRHGTPAQRHASTHAAPLGDYQGWSMLLDRSGVEQSLKQGSARLRIAPALLFEQIGEVVVRDCMRWVDAECAAIQSRRLTGPSVFHEVAKVGVRALHLRVGGNRPAIQHVCLSDAALLGGKKPVIEVRKCRVWLHSHTRNQRLLRLLSTAKHPQGGA
eukprot:CAMPEP_0119400510 /NCGR_PEP_ID=MMETSP1334-20130426/141906_1 /TAXON_ID=127549 /ORGANISM="Calcidiscus leptoporus, Strain RCC1130" /LENGTH=157 /DNA_ID=CAMNT_0007424421 /DNA_START=944 /DNA_END=1418 /DNA_ORIENTATION=-